jgi:hypothetical protein
MSDTEDKINTELQTARDDALASLAEVTEYARHKSLGDGRLRSPEREKLRIKYLRLMVQSQSERRKVLKDKDLEELKSRLEAIEESQDNEP